VYLGSGDVVTYDPVLADLERVERKLLALWEAIRLATETGEWRPRPTKLCGWCDHQSVCPEFGGTPPPYPLPVRVADGVSAEGVGVGVGVPAGGVEARDGVSAGGAEARDGVPARDAGAGHGVPAGDAGASDGVSARESVAADDLSARRSEATG
jgi:putative RecB family exonuclease